MLVLVKEGDAVALRQDIAAVFPGKPGDESWALAIKNFDGVAYGDGVRIVRGYDTPDYHLLFVTRGRDGSVRLCQQLMLHSGFAYDRVLSGVQNESMECEAVVWGPTVFPDTSSLIDFLKDRNNDRPFLETRDRLLAAQNAWREATCQTWTPLCEDYTTTGGLTVTFGRDLDGEAALWESATGYTYRPYVEGRGLLAATGARQYAYLKDGDVTLGVVTLEVSDGKVQPSGGTMMATEVTPSGHIVAKMAASPEAPAIQAATVRESFAEFVDAVNEGRHPVLVPLLDEKFDVKHPVCGIAPTPR